MPHQTRRSLMEMGSNFVITLPKSWTDFWRLEKGEKVEVISDGILLVIPPTYPKKTEIHERLMEVLLR